MMEYLSFRKMITPVFIQIIFWIGVAVIEIGCLITIIAAAAGGSPQTQQTPFGPVTQQPTGGGAGAVIAGLLGMLVLPIIWRIYCELLIVIFKIHSELVAIRGGEAPLGQGFPVVMPPK
jgi:hypothetical protein